MVVRITLLRDRLAHVIGEVIVVPDADVLVDAARGAARTARPHALDEGKPSRVHECREVVGRLFLLHDAGVLGQLRAQHAVVDDPDSGQDGGGGWHVILVEAQVSSGLASCALWWRSRVVDPSEGYRETLAEVASTARPPAQQF